MRRPDASRIANGLRRVLDGQRKACDDWRRTSSAEVRYGRIDKVTSNAMRARLPGAALGEQCRVMSPLLDAEVIAVEGRHVWLAPYAQPNGVANGALVRALGTDSRVAVGDRLIGQVLDGLGRSLSAGAPIPHDVPTDVIWRSLDAEPPGALTRRLVSTPLPIGIRAIDGLLTCGRGQRLGIFAAAGGGKSTLLAMMCAGAQADVIVLALIGERGREVLEFIEDALGHEGMKRSVVICATSDQPSLVRLRAGYVATAIAEYFRERGGNVLFMLDTVTRLARAQREIGLAIGEPPARQGYPPSVFSMLPRMLERTGNSEKGKCTAIYTCLVAGGDIEEPIADEVRGILDGHFILNRALGERNQWPAMDVLASLSRVMSQIVSKEHKKAAGKLRETLSTYEKQRDLILLGAYQYGTDPRTDYAIDKYDTIINFLKQDTFENTPFEETVQRLVDMFADAEG